MKNYIFDNYELELECNDVEEFSQILRNRNIGKKKKNSEIASLFNVDKKTDKRLYSILSLLSGSKISLFDIFEDESLKSVEKDSVTFSSGFDDNESEYQSYLGERFELLEKLKAVYDWATLADILNGQEYISFSKVEVYEKHGRDLKNLKEYVVKYAPDKYNDIFKESYKSTNSKSTSFKTANYVAYSKHIKTNNGNGVLLSTCNQEDFCKYLSKELGSCRNEKYLEMFEEIENSTFMPKQVTKDNGVIPMQVNEKEFVAILDNAKEYLPFLEEKDSDGKSVYDKLIALFEYRIPYYIGPLNTHSKKSWLVRSDEKIYPWNIKEVVDYDKSAEEFIKNLTSKCSYLPEFDVIPKYSLLYSKFCVLDELNNLRINGEKISVQLKQDIYNDVFKKYYKVTNKKLRDYLKSRNIEFDEISGIDNDFKSSLKSYKDLLEYDLTDEQKESVIKAITIFGEDKKLLRKRLKNELGDYLSDDEIKKISKLKYSGWSRLSREFLTEVEATYKESGEVVNIITAMWQTNNNLMQLLYSNDFCCDDKDNKTFIDKVNELNSFGADKTLNDIIDGLYVSPLVKRPIHQSILITKEIEKIMKRPPKKIFVEVARGAEEKKRTASRRCTLLNLYKSCKKDYPDLYDYLLNNTTDDDLRSDKLYLYFTQFGKCMYSGEEIKLDDLFNKNLYDIDHIYPQSKIKDDSLNNRVLVKKNINSKKDNEYPISSRVREKMAPFWKMLLNKKLIYKKKYERLVRNNPLSEDELSEFVSRQLVETRQSTKAVATILEQLYPDTEIVYVKAKLASDFRKEYDMLKCREVNDFHHAKDAYLNIVVGNVYNVKFTHNKVNFIKHLHNNDKGYTVNLTSMLKHNIDGAWVADNNETLNTVIETMNKNNIRYTRYSFKQKGGLFDQNILKKGKGQVPIKANDKRSDIDKYGGYNKASATYFSLVKYFDKKGKKVIRFVPINLYNEKEYQQNPVKYVRDIVEFDCEILIPCVKYNACISVDGFRMHLSAKSGKNLVCKNAEQLIIGYGNEKYIKGIAKAFQNGLKSDIEKQYSISKENNLKLYDLLINKIGNSIYKVKYDKLCGDMLSGREKFENLDIKEQFVVLNEILKILHCNAAIGNLKLIDGSGQTGTLCLNSEISNIKGIKSIKFINQSVTGLFEQEKELLTL